MRQKVLSRALTRLHMHGWRQGPRPETGFRKTYTLYDAVVGWTGEVSEDEHAALNLLGVALNVDDLDAWNNDPKRTFQDVERALVACLEAPQDPRPFYEELLHGANMPVPQEGIQ